MTTDQDRPRDDGSPDNGEEKTPDGKTDLQAQWSMAESAERMLFWAWLQTIIAGAGAILVFLALIFSGVSTRAAIEANKINREAMIAAQRAWLSIEGIEAIGPLVWEGDTAHVMIQIHVKNIGHHPAFAAGFSISAKCDYQAFVNPRGGVQATSEAAKAKSGGMGLPTIFPDRIETWKEKVPIVINRDDELYTIISQSFPVTHAYVTITAAVNYATSLDPARSFTAEIRYLSMNNAKPTRIPIGQDIQPDSLFFHQGIGAGTVAT